MYDFSRVYAKVPGQLTIPNWLDAVKAGRCQATNGPLLTLTVDGKEIGDVLEPRQAEGGARGSDRDRAGTTSRSSQLVQNGKVIQTEAGKAKDGVYTARLVREVRLDEPAWFAARIDSTDEERTRPAALRRTPRRCTSISPASASSTSKRPACCSSRLEQAREEIRSRGKFGDDAARDKILAIYTDAKKELTKRINQRGK